MKTLLRTLILIMSLWSCISNVYADKTQFVPDFVTAFIGGSPTIGNQYFTSFESNSEFVNDYRVPNNYLNTSNHYLSNTMQVTGQSSHMAYMYGTNQVVTGVNTNHRGYPAFEFSKTSIGVLHQSVLIEFYVWTNINIPQINNANIDWISLATFTSYDDIYWPRVYLINMDSTNQLYLMHMPEQEQAVHDIYQAQNHPMPLQTWVKLSTYIDYTTNNQYGSPFMALWQDGVLVSAATFNPRIDVQTYRNLPNAPSCLTSLPAGATPAQAEASCGCNYVGGLAQAHFGLYAAALLSTGKIFNDDLTISEIFH